MKSKFISILLLLISLFLSVIVMAKPTYALSCSVNPDACYGLPAYPSGDGAGGFCIQSCEEYALSGCSNGGGAYCIKVSPVKTCYPASPPEPPPPPACGSQCTETTNNCPMDCPICAKSSTSPGSTCQSAPTPSPTPTATPTPPAACNTSCQGNWQCQGAKDGCTQCINNTCQKLPSPTPTTPPSCNAPCTSSVYCQNATDGCNVCASGTCQKPTPTPTATPTPTPTNTPTPTPTPTATPTPSPTPTPTPTPLPFDEAMCKCDQLDFTSIALGTTTNITAYGKVEGVNVNYAKIPTMTFKFYQGSGTVVNEIQKATINTTVVEQTANKVRYQAIWPLNLPTSLDTKQTYRIQAKADCSRKNAVLINPAPTSVVLATTDTQPEPTFWSRITSFFAGLFGFGATENTQTAITQDAPTPTLTQEQKKQLQLKTFTPAKGVSTDNCSFIKFSF